MNAELLRRWRNTVASENGPPSWVTRLVLMCIWFGQENAHRHGGEPAAAVRELVRWSGLHPHTVRRHLRIAESAAWVRRIEAHDGTRWEPVLGEGAIV